MARIFQKLSYKKKKFSCNVSGIYNVYIIVTCKNGEIVDSTAANRNGAGR